LPTDFDATNGVVTATKDYNSQLDKAQSVLHGDQYNSAYGTMIAASEAKSDLNWMSPPKQEAVG
jgi:hypothetical protein